MKLLFETPLLVLMVGNFSNACNFLLRQNQIYSIISSKSSIKSIFKNRRSTLGTKGGVFRYSLRFNFNNFYQIIPKDPDFQFWKNPLQYRSSKTSFVKCTRERSISSSWTSNKFAKLRLFFGIFSICNIKVT